MSSMTTRWLSVLLALGLSGSVIAQEGQKPTLKDVSEEPLIAKITLPWNNASVRAHVPVFGFAGGKNFKAYRLEYGQGKEPKAWILISSGTKPYNQDPWSAGQVKWSTDMGAEGTLGNWMTGLTTYQSGDWKENLLGEYTLRLVVEGKDGTTAEDRVHVIVAEVITRLIGGKVRSPDDRFHLKADKEAIPSSFVLVSMLPSSEPKLDPKLKLIGSAYEFQPPGLKFLKPAELTAFYKDTELDTNGDGKQGIPPEKLGIYYYEPVKEVWVRMPSRVAPDTKALVAEMRGSTQYIAYVALMADLIPPEPPRLNPISDLSRYSTVLSGEAEPGSSVQLLLDGRGIANCQADDAGKFATGRLRIAPGARDLMAKATDPAGNESQPSEKAHVVFSPTPPKSVKSVRWLGNTEARRGDRFLVELTGEAASPRVDHTLVTVTSKTDPKGIEVELAETGPQTGIFVGLVTVADASSPEVPAIGARLHNEKIVVASCVDPSKKAEISYVDNVPPSTPRITCPAYPMLVLNTFEEQEKQAAFAGWSTVEDKYGAALSIGEESGNRFLKLTRQQFQSHMGAVAFGQLFDAAQWPLVSFDCIIPSGMKIDVVVRVANLGPFTIRMTGKDRPYYPLIGAATGVRDDGKWAHVLVPLYRMLTRRFPDTRSFLVESIGFGSQTDQGSWRVSPGASGPVGEWVGIDNFAVFRHTDLQTADFAWQSQDANGIAGYSFAFDRSVGTVPPDKPVPDTTATVKLTEPGVHYLHVRAVDRCGNWSRTSHYMVLSDREPPVAGDMTVDQTNGFARVMIPLKDTGVGVDPGSFRLEVGECCYDWQSGVLSYDDAKGVLVADTSLPALPRIAADGERITVKITAADLLGQQIEKKSLGEYVAKSPLRVTPASPDGKNGFYVTRPTVGYEPVAGEKALFEWRVNFADDPWSRRGQSLNTLLLTLRYPDGQVKSVSKEIKLDTTVPQTKAFVRNQNVEKPIADDPLPRDAEVSLRHEDYALQTGALETSLYDKSDFTGLLPDTRTPSQKLDSWRLPDGITAKAATWDGSILAPAAGDYRFRFRQLNPFANVRISIDGEAIGKKDAASVKEEMEASAFLAKGWHQFRIDYAVEDRPVQGISVSWTYPGHLEYGIIPPEDLATLKSLATAYYRWDKGPWQIYTRPFNAQAGAHQLDFYTENLAGHKEPVNTVTVTGK
jgi:hypothetical protein